MSIHKMKQMTFRQVDFDEWKEVAEKSLKGRSFDTLFTETFEGITIHPLYTKKFTAESSKVIQATKMQENWLVAQHTFATSSAAYIELLCESLERGNEVIVYDGTRPFTWTPEDLQTLASKMVLHPILFLHVQKDDELLRVFDFIEKKDRHLIKGFTQLQVANELQDFTQLRTINIDLWDIHHDGADAVTELALALSKIVQVVEQLKDTSVFSEIAEKIWVHFAVDTHFFMEIAKLRAFRLLWRALTMAYEQTDKVHIPLYVTTSLRSYSKLDPYVNLLRAGNMTLSAILGEADLISTYPHDILTGPTAHSIRYARNVQLVLREETHFDKVHDPAAGSSFIESLTECLVEKAWERFLSIEAHGGYESYLQLNSLEPLLSKRKEAVATAKQSLIGTNVYADLSPVPLDDWNGIVVKNRLAEDFEQLRVRFQEDQPKTVLLLFGPLKSVKARADFVSGFLATGGLATTWSPHFEQVDEAIEWIKREKPAYMIVCASNDKTQEIVEPLLERMPGKYLIDVAGSYDEETKKTWQSKGLNGFIYANQNRIEKLEDIYAKWKGGNGRD